MSRIKIRFEVIPSFSSRFKKKKPGNYCRGCGSPLRSPESISRGYGWKCWKSLDKIMIIEIPSGEDKDSK